MSKKQHSRFLAIAACALGLALIVSGSAFVGVVAGLKFSQQDKTFKLPPALQLHASKDARTKSISLSTGSIDGSVEGLYVLDHISGNLQCWILNAKTGEVGGVYKANIMEAIAANKGGESDFVMTTGQFFWNGGNTGNLAPAQSVCYIADGATGNVVGFALSYDKQAIRRGIVQQGTLELVCAGPARDVVTRDQ